MTEYTQTTQIFGYLFGIVIMLFILGGALYALFSTKNDYSWAKTHPEQAKQAEIIFKKNSIK